MSVGLGHLFISRLSAPDYKGIWQGTEVPEKNRNGVVWPSNPVRALAPRLCVPPYSQGYRRNRAPKEEFFPLPGPGRSGGAVFCRTAPTHRKTATSVPRKEKLRKYIARKMDNPPFGLTGHSAFLS